MALSVEDIIKKYGQYFKHLDTPSLIVDERMIIVWRNDQAEHYRKHLKVGMEIQYYIAHKQYEQMLKLKPGEYMYIHIKLSEYVPAFVKRNDDCFVFRIGRYDAAVVERLTKLLSDRYLGNKENRDGFPAKPNYRRHINPNKMDRIAALFEGVYTDGMKYIELVAPLKQYAKQATYALYGIEVEYLHSETHDTGEVNVPDLYMLLSAMVICTLFYAGEVPKMYLGTRRNSCEQTVIEISCDTLGFAGKIVEDYKDLEKLKTLCEYGAQYMNLMLIGALVDRYFWEFDIYEDNGRTYLALTLPAKFTGRPEFSFFDDDFEDEVIFEMLSPYHTKKSNQ